MSSETQTQTNGAFVLNLTGPGKYLVRIDRLGFKSFVSDTISLSSDTTILFSVNEQPIELPTIKSEGTSNCEKHHPLSPTSAALWDEISKALRASIWTSKNLAVEFQWEEIDRILNRQSRAPIGSAVDHVHEDVVHGSIFSAHPEDSLVAKGFIQKIDKQYVYFGPDAELVMSDAFQSTHCFHSVIDSKRPDLVGLAFDANPTIKPSDIDGILWVNKFDHKLRQIEFSYHRSPFGAPRSAAGGVIHFDEMPNGMWIVNDWTIWSPAIAPDGQVAFINETRKKVVKARVDGRIVYEEER